MEKNLLKLYDMNYPIEIIEHKKTEYGSMFHVHGHKNYLQFFCFDKGICTIYCGEKAYTIENNGVILINNKELHYGENKCRDLHFYVIRINLNLLKSYNIEVCSKKYIDPILQNLIIFNNKVTDTTIEKLIIKAVSIFKDRNTGYELELMSITFKLLAVLMKDNVKKKYSDTEAEMLMKKRKAFEDVFKFVEANYRKHISLEELSEIASMSQNYFCRKFKMINGKTPMEYINRIRIEHAAVLLNEGTSSITDAAFSCGFEDSNYFSRVFKKYMKESPSEYLKNRGRYLL